jgi:hypothetical protein
MRLDLNTLEVQSFATSPAATVVAPADTGPGGPDSECYICYQTGNTVPSCMGYQCGPGPVDYRTDTFIDPACGWA